MFWMVAMIKVESFHRLNPVLFVKEKRKPGRRRGTIRSCSDQVAGIACPIGFVAYKESLANSGSTSSKQHVAGAYEIVFRYLRRQRPKGIVTKSSIRAEIRDSQVAWPLRVSELGCGVGTIGQPALDQVAKPPHIPMLWHLPQPLHPGGLVGRIWLPGPNIDLARHSPVDNGLLLLLKKRNQLLLGADVAPDAPVGVVEEADDGDLLGARRKWKA